uniref:Uncharacterized protein n=1 Tax=Avena sativa TaxID=4498 RepID=A0ACD5XLR9_AVESA
MATATEAKSAGRALRRPLQPRDSNVASPTVASAAALAGKGKTKARTRLAAATPASPPPSVVRSYVKPEGSRVECPLKEVSLAEELEKARERRGRLRVARQLTDRVLDEREEALRWEVREWERRAQEQRRLVAELMRLIGMPEVSTYAFFLCTSTFLSLHGYGLVRFDSFYASRDATFCMAGLHSVGVAKIQGGEEEKGRHFRFGFTGFSLFGFDITGRSWGELMWSRTGRTRDDSHDI